MYCKNCGTELKDDAVYCSHCGTPVNPSVEVEKKKDSSAEDTVLILGIVAAGLLVFGMAIPSFVVAIIAMFNAKKLKGDGGELTGNAKIGNIFAIVSLVVSGISVAASVIAIVVYIVSYFLGISIMVGTMNSLFDSLDVDSYCLVFNMLQSIGL